MYKILTILIVGISLLDSVQLSGQGVHYSVSGSQFIVLENIEDKVLSPGFSGGIGYTFENHFLTELHVNFKSLQFQSQSIQNSTSIFSGGWSVGYNFDFENNFRIIQLLGISYNYYNPKIEISHFSESKYILGGFSNTSFQFLVSERFAVSQTIEYHLLNSNKVTSVMVGDFTQFLSFGLGVSYYLTHQNYFPPENVEAIDYYAVQYDQSDRDYDGVPDYKDNCPDVPGTKDKYGCPDDDNDSDGIPNNSDSCVDEPETFNGFEDEDGCPDSILVVKPASEVIRKPAEVTVAVEAKAPIVLPIIPEKKIEIPITADVEFAELKISFKGSPSALKRDQVEQLMLLDKLVKSTPEFKMLEINVYCWDQSNQGENKKIGEKRMKVIVDFLMHSGVKKESIKSNLITKKHNKGDGQYYEYKITN